MLRVPDGDDRPRLTCPDCGYVAYENPRIVVGAICVWDGRFLLCQRAIEPRKGFWTPPSGFLEMNESTEEGAIREVWEEARAEVELDGLLALYSIPAIGQVHLIYRAHLKHPGFEAGPESLDVRLFAWDDIPWDDLAFPNARWSLEHWRQMQDEPLASLMGVPEEWRHRLGREPAPSSPSAPKGAT
ncbi:ADP-ribose pyrophosphatase [Rhodospirillaceae bacterium LM-1]|nr:ADP-ribose pyrophosphatase [Rhodospirillaceae bacterium LM-1]